MSRTAAALLLALALAATGCQRFQVRTENRVRVDGPVDTRVDLVPVPQAGPVRPVVVQPGDSSARVALIDVDGLLLNTPFAGPYSVGENPVAHFKEKLDAAAADPCVSAVVLRVNSHGGSVAACLAMRGDLERFKARTGKPIVGCLLDVGCGGAYYLASAADHIVVTPATVTGAIGVILNLFKTDALMGQFSITPRLVKAGPLVNMGSFIPDSSESDEQAKQRAVEVGKIFQAMADEYHRKFQADIRASRPAIDPGQGTTFDGRIFTGSQAVARGLADRVGDLESAIQLAAGLANPSCPSAKPEVVLYRRSNDPAHSIYAVTANVPLQGAGLLPNIPGLDRTKLPAFLSMWQPELTMEKLGGK